MQAASCPSADNSNVLAQVEVARTSPVAVQNEGEMEVMPCRAKVFVLIHMKH